MAELQTVAAAFDIAHLALNAARLIHRVIRGAQSEADILFRRTHHVASLAENVAKVVRERERARGDAPSPVLESSIYESIDGSLEECRTSLSFIAEQLQPFQDVTHTRPLGRLQRNFEFIRSDDFRTAQQSIIESQLQSLSLSISLLNSLDMNNHRTLYVDTVLALTDNVRRDVTSQQLRQRALAEERTTLVSGRASLDNRTNPVTYHPENCQHCQEVERDSPLSIAVKVKDAVIVQNLLRAGVDVRAKDVTGRTVLHHAAENLDKRVLTELFKTSESCDPGFLNETTVTGETALMITADNFEDPLSYILADALLERGCDANLQDNAHRSAMYIVIDGPAESQRVKFAKLLYSRGADFESLRYLHPRNFESFRIEIAPALPLARRHSSTSDLYRSQTAPTNSSTETHNQSFHFPNMNRRRNSDAVPERARTEPPNVPTDTERSSIWTQIFNRRRNSTPDLTRDQNEPTRSPTDRRRASVVSPFPAIVEHAENRP